MSVEERVEALGIDLPVLGATAGNYVRAKQAGPLCFLSGAVSIAQGQVLTGVAEDNRAVHDGYAAARACGVMLLAALKAQFGSLDAVAQIVSITGYVQAAPGFTQLPQVMDGCSDLMVEVFGEAGRHTRSSVGVSALPRGAMVEVAMVVEVRT